MNIPTVSNMESPRTGQPVANQYIIETEEGTYFQSYRSIIAFIPKNLGKSGLTMDKIHLDEKYWNYSRTTSKYRSIFLGDEPTQTTYKKIKSGEYKLANLN